jgi:hypothetical protein
MSWLKIIAVNVFVHSDGKWQNLQEYLAENLSIQHYVSTEFILHLLMFEQKQNQLNTCTGLSLSEDKLHEINYYRCMGTMSKQCSHLYSVSHIHIQDQTRQATYV